MRYWFGSQPDRATFRVPHHAAPMPVPVMPHATPCGADAGAAGWTERSHQYQEWPPDPESENDLPVHPDGQLSAGA